MPELNADVEIDVEDFLDECDPEDFKDIVKYLVENKYILPSQRLYDGRMTYNEEIFEEALNKLRGKWNMLSEAEEEAIITISKKF